MNTNKKEKFLFRYDLDHNPVCIINGPVTYEELDTKSVELYREGFIFESFLLHRLYRLIEEIDIDNYQIEVGYQKPVLIN